jgi:4-hydroxy-2-oxoheptanedioate aldolase
VELDRDVEQPGPTDPTRLAPPVSYGGWAALPDPEILEAMVRARCEWVCLDLQHGAFDFRTAAHAIQLLDAFGVPAFIRVSWLELHLMPRLLDFGAEGVIVAMVDGAELIGRVIAATRYQPQGTRSYGGQRWGLRALPVPDLEIVPKVFAMIETAAGIENLDEIAEVPGLTGLFLGEADLGLGLGLGVADRSHPAHRAAVDRMVAVGRASGLQLGTSSRDGEDALYWSSLGFGLVGVGCDIGLLSSALRDNLERARSGAPRDDRARAADSFYGGREAQR